VQKNSNYCHSEEREATRNLHFSWLLSELQVPRFARDDSVPAFSATCWGLGDISMMGALWRKDLIQKDLLNGFLSSLCAPCRQ
jgi:hypothetical protein